MTEPLRFVTSQIRMLIRPTIVRRTIESLEEEEEEEEEKEEEEGEEKDLYDWLEMKQIVERGGCKRDREKERDR